MKRMVILSLCIFLVLLSLNGCGGKDQTAANDKGDKNSSKTDSSKNMPKNKNLDENLIPVEITPVVRGDISSHLVYNSTVETEELADVYSRIPGLIEKILVEEGGNVKRNQALLQIEKAEYAIAEEEAKINFEKQKSEFNRFKKLIEKKLISQEEFENARLAFRQAELKWKQAQLNLDYTIVRAPISGVVGERYVRLGDRIQTATKLFTVANLRDKVVKLYVPQDELANCYLNQKAYVSSDVHPEMRFSAWVKRISPIVDPVSGTFKVTLGIKDPQNALPPGMFVSAQLIVDTHKNSQLLPKPALLYENERSYFFVMTSDSVKKYNLKKGFEDAEKVELLNNLPDSSKIIVVGQGGLKDGSKIKVIKTRYYSWQNN